MTGFQPPDTLRQHRPLLMALEAIGWLHMTGKAKLDFLRDPEKNAGKQWYQALQVPLEQSFSWLDSHLKQAYAIWKLPGTPPTLANLLKSMFEDFAEKQSKKNLVGLLQAGHAMASGIEKQSYPSRTVEYLGQDVTHMWLSTAFGHPVRNLLDDPPELLTDVGWKRLLEQIKQLLTVLKQLGDNSSPNDIDGWWRWRDGTVGPEGWLRKAFTETLAETRLPNNDVTLFDQSYVAAVLFKSAAAGAILEGSSFPWSSNGLKQQTRWRLLTIGIGADHYEARAVKIGDWTGARLALDEFFTRVRKLVEVDLAVGSLLYRDGGVCVFSFPGERTEEEVKKDILKVENWKQWLVDRIDDFANKVDDCPYARDALGLEMPPYCHISEPSRSLVGITAEIRKAREIMAVPLHREWQIPGQDSSDGHVCPVCLVRRNDDRTNKQKRCKECYDRRDMRCKKWLKGELGSDSIWISEVADANDRVALVTMSLDIEPWLDARRLDALRTQAIAEWRKFNPVLSEFWQRDENKRKKEPNPVNIERPLHSLHQEIIKRLDQFNGDDLLLCNLQEGYRRAKGGNDNRSDDEIWNDYFSLIVEDRDPNDQPKWKKDDLGHNAAWLTHQLFCKLASPGRIYRFWRQAESFFKDLLAEFRGIAAADQNRWRVHRLVVKPDNGSSGPWEDRQTYNGRYRDAPVSLLYRAETKDFLTICNLARLLKPEQGKGELQGKTFKNLEAEDHEGRKENRDLTIGSVSDDAGALGVYHPVIPLELSPVRFRVLLPLEAASECVDRAIERWKDQFARVWHRLPLRVGVVAFPRMTPFQAVIEAARNIEADLDGIKTPETWRVEGCETREGVTALSLKSLDNSHELLQTMPTRLPDGRDDVFYPYLAVEDKEVRFPLDFRHPSGQVFRHAKDLRSGDGALIYPSFITTVFLDGTARRFEPLCRRQLTQWLRMRDLWRLIDRHAPSQTALRGAWSELVERRDAWKGPDGNWLEGGKTAWLDLGRALFHERLGVQGAFLETLVAAAEEGLLDWSLEWHMIVLKKQVSGLPVHVRTKIEEVTDDNT